MSIAVNMCLSNRLYTRIKHLFCQWTGFRENSFCFRICQTNISINFMKTYVYL